QLGGINSQPVTLTVTAATLATLQVSPANPSVPLGATQAFKATGVYTDNTTQDLTATVTWQSDAPSVASISNAAPNNGLASTLAVGTAHVSAMLGSVTSDPVVLTVTSAALVSIEIDPAAPTIARGLTQQFTATGLYTDNSTQDLTASVTWSSSKASVATISNASGSAGLATSHAVGSTTIGAVSGSIS